MAPNTFPFFFLIIAIASFPIFTFSSSSAQTFLPHSRISAADACSGSEHSDCLRSISSVTIPATARRTTLSWARRAVSTSLVETNRVLSKFDGTAQLPAALPDCAESFGIVAKRLRQSTAELRRMERSTGDEFWSQMNNVRTWMDGALTHLDDCNTELAASKDPLVDPVRSLVLGASDSVGNAHELVVKLAKEAGMQ